MRPVPLLHMRVVVRAIRARAREQHGLGSLLCPRHNRVVDELRAVVAVHAQQGKWETRLQIAQLRQCAVLTTVFQRALFRPIGADVHRIQHPQVAVIQSAATTSQRNPQGCKQPIQSAGTDGQQAFPHISIKTAMIRFISGQPFRQQRHQPTATRLESGKPDRLEDGQQRVGMILARTSQYQ